jgi:type III secretion protein V
LPFPGIVFWAADDLVGVGYNVLVHDVPVDTIEFGANESTSPEAVAGGDVEGQIGAHVVRVLRREARSFVGVQETQWILERVTADYPGLVSEVQKALPVQRIAEILRRLLEEQIPIRDIRSILESMVAWGPKEKDLIMLTEYVRADLGRMIGHRASRGLRKIPAIVLDQELEQTIRQAIKPTPAGNYLTLEPRQVETIIQRLEQIATETPPENLAVVTAADIRRYFRRMIERRLHWLEVYSFQELNGEIDLQLFGSLTL